MSSSSQPNLMSPDLAEIEKRIQALESEVFKGGGPSGTGVSARLKQLGDELAALQVNSSSQIISLNQKIDRVIQIVAELKQIMETSRHSRTMSGPSM